MKTSTPRPASNSATDTVPFRTYPATVSVSASDGCLIPVPVELRDQPLAPYHEVTLAISHPDGPVRWAQVPEPATCSDAGAVVERLRVFYGEGGNPCPKPLRFHPDSFQFVWPLPNRWAAEYEGHFEVEADPPG